jgi:hypothetical protein
LFVCRVGSLEESGATARAAAVATIFEEREAEIDQESNRLSLSSQVSSEVALWTRAAFSI